VEELLALSSKKSGGFFVQEEVEKCVPHFVIGISGGRVVRDHCEEECVPCYDPSALQRSHEDFMQGPIKGLPRMAGSTSQQVKSSTRLPSEDHPLGSCITVVHHGRLTMTPLVVNGEQDVAGVPAPKQ